MSTSQIPAAINNLFSICTTVMPTGVDVLDGPPLVQPARDYLIVGGDSAVSMPGTVMAAVDGSSTFVGLPVGQQHRDETFTIHCLYVAFSGDPTLTTLRARAFTNIGLLENTIRVMPGASLNGALGAPGWTQIVITRVDQDASGNGAQVHVAFGLVCRGRI